MILMRGQFVGPLQAVSLGNRVVTQVKSTRSLGVEIDSDFYWNVHVKELIKSSSQKLNLLRSLYFYHVRQRLIFISKKFYHQLPMGWLYGVPAANRSLISWRRYMYVPQRSSMAWIGTHPAIRSWPKASGPLLKIYTNIDYLC